MQKKFKKLEKNSCGIFSSKNWLEMAEKETKIQIIVSFRFVPTQCVIENSKQIAKKFKKL